MRTIEEIRQDIKKSDDSVGIVRGLEYLNLFMELTQAQDAEIARLRQKLEWQPIETAPHNQWLFTYGDPSLKKPVPGKLFDADDERSAGWRTFGGAPINPTCYFPLPQPPLPQAQEGNHEND